MFKKINRKNWAVIICIALLFNIIPINVEWGGKSYSNTLVAKADNAHLGANQDVFYTSDNGIVYPGGSDAGTGYGAEDFIGSDGSYFYVAGLRFDLSTISKDAVITDAKLGIEINYINNTGVFLDLYGLDDDSWGASTPSYSEADRIGTREVLDSFSAPNMKLIDVKDFVQEQLADNAATFLIGGNSTLGGADQEFSFTCTANTDSNRTKPYLDITYYVPPSLAQVTGATLSSAGVATWNDVPNDSGYSVELYKNGSILVTTATETTNVTTHNFLSDMRTAGVGTYTVKVTAKGDKTNYINGPTSSASNGQIIAQLSTVSAGLTWTGDVAHWTSIANATSYDVQLYKNSSSVGTVQNVLQANASAGADFASAVSSNGGGTYTYKVTAKGDSQLYLDASQSAASNDNIKAIQLSTVSTPTLSSAGVATWSNVSNATSYAVQLYKDGVAQGSPVIVASGTTSNDFLSTMRAAGAGNYTVQVTAKNAGPYYSDASSSVASSAQTIVQLSAVSAGLTWTGDVAHWSAVSNAVSYDVQLYQGGSTVGSPVNVLAANIATGVDFTSAISGAGYGNFTYKVTAKGNNTLILDASQSADSNGNLKATPLAQASNVVLSALGVASWDTVANASSYTVKLYKNGSDTGVSYNLGTTTKNMLADMRANGVGTYTVKVTAIGDSVNYSNGPESVASASQAITKLALATGLSWTGDTAHWSAVTSAVSYDVQLYKGASAVSGALVNVLAANRAAGVDFSSQIAAQGGGVYTYKVTAIGDTNLLLDGDQSAASNEDIKSIQLDQVTNVLLSSSGVASWNNVSNESSFSVQLYKNGSALGSPVTKSADTLSHSFLSDMRTGGIGTYTVQVMTVGDGTYFTDGVQSVSVSSRTITKLSTSSSLTWNGTTAHFSVVTDASSYEVQLYKEGSAVSGAVKTVSGSSMSPEADFSTEIASAGAGNYTFTVKAIGDSLLILDGEESLPSTTKIIAAPLAQVSGVSLSSVGVVSWNDVANEVNYSIQLFKNGNPVGLPVLKNANQTTHNMLSSMRSEGVGVYTAKVTAIGDEISYSDAPESLASASQVVTKLSSPTGLSWTGDVAHWSTATNAVSYDVQLYQGVSAVSGALVNVLEANIATGADFSSQMSSHGGGIYTYKITAKGDSNSLFLDSDQSVASNNNIKPIQIAQVTNVLLSATGVASWDNVSGESNFVVQLYKNGSALGAAVTVNANSLSQDFLSDMRTAGIGTYTVKVKAIGDGTYYTDGLLSASSTSQEIVKSSTSSTLNWNGYVAHFSSVTGASSYDVQLFRSGSSVVVKTINASDLAAGVNFSPDMAIAGAGNYTFKVTAKGDGYLYLEGDESNSSAVKIVATPLPSVTGVSLSTTGLASWSDVSNEINYAVQLYKDGNAVGTPVLKNANETSHNFLALMRSEGAGAYTVKVTAVGDGISYSNGVESASSTSQTMIKLTKASGLTWVGKTAHFDNVSDAVSYEVQLYKDGLASGLVKPLSVAAASTGFDFSSEMAAGGVGSYTFTVKVKGDSNLILDSVVSNESAIKIEAVTLPQGWITLSSSGIATWENVVHETGYQVQLYKDGVACGTPIIKGADAQTVDFLPKIRELGAGSYTVTVMAKGDGTFYLDGTISTPSNQLTVFKLAPVAQTMTWSNSVAKWGAVLDARGYAVQLYKNGIAVGTPVIIASKNADSGVDFNTAIKTNGFGSYTYKVIAKGNESDILDSSQSEASSELTMKSVDSKATFDKNSDSQNHKNISVELQLDTSLVKSIKNGDNVLKTKKDYSIVGNVVTIDKDYFDKLAAGNAVITIIYSNGDKQILKVTVADITTSVTEDTSVGSSTTAVVSNQAIQNGQIAQGTSITNTQAAASSRAGAAGPQTAQSGGNQLAPQQTEEAATRPQDMGNFQVKTEASNDVPSFTMPSNDALYDAVLTEEDKAALAAGEQVEVKVVVEAIEEPEDANIVKENLGENQFGMFMDISVLKTVGDKQTKVHEMSQPITLTCEIPDAFKGMPEYGVLRVHNGEPAILDDEDDVQDTITFSTDRCSTYALIYKEADTKGTGEVATVIQTENHSIPLWVIIVGVIIVGGMIGVYARKRNKEGKEKEDTK